MRTPRRGQRFNAVAMLGLVCGLCGCAPKLNEPQIIATHEHSGLAPGESFVFAVQAQPDTPLLVEASQTSGEVRFELNWEGTTESIEYSSAWRRETGELLFIDSALSRRGFVTVVAEPTNRPRTRVTATVSELRPTTSADNKRNAAFGLLSEAARLNGTSNIQPERQIELLREAQRLFGYSGERRWQAMSQLSIAYLQLNHLGDWSQAIHWSHQASKSFRRLGLGSLEAQADMLAGSASMEFGLTQSEYRKAQRTLDAAQSKLEAAMQHQEELGRTFDAAIAANYLGVLHYYRRDAPKARSYYDRARALLMKEGEVGALHMTLQNIALLDTDSGDYRAAAETYEQILSQWPPDAERHGYADTLHNSALSQAQLGNVELALERHIASRALLAEQGDKSGEARALHGIASALMHIGAPDRALPLLETALQMRRDLKNQQQLFASLKVTGTAYRELGEPARALSRHREALALAQSPFARLLVTAEIASDLEMLDQVGEGYAVLQEALDKQPLRDHPLIAAIAAQADYLAVISGHEVSTHLASLRTTVSSVLASGGPFVSIRAITSLAMAELAAGELDAAAATAAQALSEALRYRSSFASIALRTRLAAIERDALETRVNALMYRSRSAALDAASDAFAERALSTIDAARARLMLDLQREHLQRLSSADRRTQTQLMYEQISGKWFRAQQLLDRAEPPLEEVQRLYAEVAVLQARSELPQAATDRDSTPEQRVPASLSEFSFEPRFSVGEVGVAYFLGKQASWAWRIDSDGLEAFELPNRRVIRPVAAQLADAVRRPTDDFAWRAAAQDLAAQVLHPLSIPRTGLSSVRIVPDDVLHSVPFILLPTAPTGAPLIEVADVFLAPTIAPLSGLSSAKGENEAPRRVLVVADPIYSRSDARIEAPSGEDLTAEPREGLPRLTGSAAEARAIAGLVSATVTLLLGERSAIPSFVKQPLSTFDIVHFATHGRTLPGMQEAVGLLLSTVDASGHPISGWLRPDDVLDLQLRARIVFLSACDSAVSERVPFQGAVGLKEAFIAAGAESVVASHWPLADVSAPFLVRAFYDHFINNGQTPPAALRAAQREMARTRWKHPFYWSGLGVTLAGSHGLPNGTPLKNAEMREMSK